MYQKKKTASFILSLLLVIFFAFGFSCCGLLSNDGSSGSETPPAPTVTVTLSKSELSIVNGQSATLTATVENTEETVEWTTEDDTKVRLEANGNSVTVVALAEGETTVTATVAGESASCEITITPAVKVILSQSKISIVKGLTATLAATVENTEETIVWTTEDNATVRIETNGNTVTVVALAEGETTVTATVAGVSISCEITVTSGDNIGEIPDEWKD